MNCVIPPRDAGRPRRAPSLARDGVDGPPVTVVGLGPGGDGHVTTETLAAIERIGHRYLRTARHPTPTSSPAATTFDDVYEAADRSTDVYAEIVERLVAGAAEHGEILYAVPGSPLVLERTVELLRADGRARVTVLPAMSFLDVAWARLGIDPRRSGRAPRRRARVRPRRQAGDGPLLIAHTHANWVLSDIKLAVERADGSEPVTILQRLGTADERIVETTWAELDRPSRPTT